MSRKIIVAAGAGIVIAGLALAGWGYQSDSSLIPFRADSDAGPRQVMMLGNVAVDPQTETLGTDQYIGPCSVVTPPNADPCQAAQLVIRYQFFDALVNTAYYPTWKKANPGEFTRLKALMALPKCSTPSAPQPQTMITQYGAMLGDAIEAYACALGTEAIAFPAPNSPPVGGSKDKTAPTPPGALQLTPEGNTNG